jgi:hypothetical protein
MANPHILTIPDADSSASGGAQYTYEWKWMQTGVQLMAQQKEKRRYAFPISRGVTGCRIAASALYCSSAGREAMKGGLPR